jgi:hypothetical protein
VERQAFLAGQARGVEGGTREIKRKITGMRGVEELTWASSAMVKNANVLFDG